MKKNEKADHDANLEAIHQLGHDVFKAVDAIKNAEYTAERIREDAKRTAEREHKELDKLAPEQWGALCEALGIPFTTNTWTVRDAVRKVSDAARGWAQSSALTRLKGELQDALRHVEELVASAGALHTAPAEVAHD